MGFTNNGASVPRRVLAVRFQALGDTIITLPYLLSLKKQYPDMALHFLTRNEVAAIPKALTLFDKVITIGGKRNVTLQAIMLCLLTPFLWMQRYDAMLDLQNNKLSRLLKRLLFIGKVAEFDNCSLLPAGERTRIAVQSLFEKTISMDPMLKLKYERSGLHLMQRSGWNGRSPLVVLNPAGFFPSRNWPIEYYVEFAKLWLTQVDPNARFVLLLLTQKRATANAIAAALGASCIDLTGRADQVAAFSIIGKASLVLSEDSGLMHMAWVQGVPTLALFSSSRAAWSKPLGKNSLCLDSSDLPCGPCMLEVCQFGDNRCLTRYKPSFVLEKANELVNRSRA